MLYEELSQLMESGELVSIIRDDINPNSLITGFIHNLSNEVILISQYDSDGLYSGIAMFDTEQISEVYWGDREHDSIKALIQRNSFAIKLPDIKPTSFEKTLVELDRLFKVISFFPERSGDGFDIGKVTGVDSNWIKIRCFGTKRSLSKTEKLIRVQDITKVEVDSPYSNNIIYLHEQAQKDKQNP